MDEVRIDVSQAAANWIWLAPSVSFQTAIFVGEPSSHVLQALQLHVGRVVLVPPGNVERLAEVRQLRTGWAYVDLDLVWREGALLKPLVVALEAALRGGGNLCLASSAQDGRMTARVAALWRIRRALSMARRTGFRLAGRYHAVPNPDAPITLVPASRHGATIYETLSEPVPNRNLRLRLARSAFHPLLFRGHLCLCSA